MEESKSSLPNKGNNQNEIVCQKAACIYDITTFFTKKFLSTRKDATAERMVQAALSSKMSIAEGCKAAATSSEAELDMVVRARASMQELLASYENYLSDRLLRQWADDDPRTTLAKVLGMKHNCLADYTAYIERCSDETIANLVILMIRQLDTMLECTTERTEH